MPYVSRVTVDRSVAAPLSVAQEVAEGFFREAEGGIALHVPLRDLVPRFPGRLRKPVRLVVATHADEVEQGRLHDAFLVEWSAGTRLLPHFHGTARLRIDSVDATRLILEGAYRPPGGAAGRLFDLVVGRRIARATMRELVDRVAARIEWYAGRANGGSGSAA